MLFRVDQPQNRLHAATSDWQPQELELEKLIVTTEDGETAILDDAVFGEQLLVLRRQVATRTGKRADILALDRAGRLVVVELKRNEGRLGVETQALQYLADFWPYQGERLLARFSRDHKDFAGTVRGFLGDDVPTQELNRKSRVILVARSFDPALFSMGEWLASTGVPVRCITYHPVEVGGERFISFSVAFDRSSESLFPLEFSAPTSRAPRIYWHSIGDATDEWWRFLVEQGLITASFGNRPGDRGEALMRGYVSGDTIVAYAKGVGAVGWGVVEEPE